MTSRELPRMSGIVFLFTLIGIGLPASSAAQVPGITGVDPYYQMAGGPAFVLTVFGNNFVAPSPGITGSTIQWNNNQRSTTFVSSEILRAVIPSSDIALPGTANITVLNPDPGGGISNTAVFTINQVPSIAGLTPNYQIAGQPAFVLTVNGANFLAGSKVSWNGALRTTTYVASNQLRADIPASDIANQGTANVAVVNPDPGGGTSNQVTFTIYDSTPNPVPQLTSLSPSFNLAGGAPFTLTVTGTGFVSGSVVRWNLSPRSTTLVSSTQLRADILAGDIATSVPVSVSVLNPVPGGGISNSLEFTISVNSPVPTVSSINPSVVTRLGPSFVLTVIGSNFVSGSTVYWNGSVRPTTFVDNATLRVNINDTDITTAGSAAVNVVNPSPGGGSSNSLNLTISDASLAPVANTLSPASITAGVPGLQLTVRGVNFVPNSVVRWNGLDRTTTFISGTELRASILPADVSAVGTASVTVFTPPPGGGLSSTLVFAIDNPLPSITALNPSSALVGSSAVVVTVSGVNFVNGSQVRWNGSDLVTTFVSTAQLKATIPAANLALAGRAAVTVVNLPTGGGTSASEPFTIANAVPSITSLVPSTATAYGSGFTLIVNGAKFIPESKVRWNGILRSITFINDSLIRVDVNSDDLAQPGTIGITVNNPEPGGGDSSTSNLVVANPLPSVVSMSPNSAGVGTLGTTSIVTGSSFVAGSKVRWNGTDRVTVFISRNQLKVSLTAADLAKAGIYSVSVFNGTPGGGLSDSLPFTVNYGQPTISSISPDSGAAGSASITFTVNGSNFINASVIRWNNNDLTTKFVSSTKLTATLTPTELPQSGSAAVTVFTPAPGGGISNAVTFTITPSNPVPTISSLDPTTLQMGSASPTLTVNGSNFVGGSKVRWNGSDRDTEFVSSSILKASLQDSDIAKTGTANVTVFNPTPGGGVSAPKSIIIGNPVPEITSLTPGVAPIGSPNLNLTVGGKNFINTSKVRWNGVDLATKFVNDSQLTATVPSANLTQEGTANVTVFNPTPGGGISAPQTFTVAYSNPVPSITSLSPTSVRAGSPAFGITVIGTNFVKSSKVLWNEAERGTVYVSSTRLTVTILDTDVAQIGAASLTVSNPEPGGGTSNTKPFTITNPLPVITSLSPGAIVAGNPDLTLTVVGKNFLSTAKVRWNGGDRSTSFINSAQLTATIPAADISKVGTYVVTVVNLPADGPSNPVNFLVNSLTLSNVALNPTSAKAGWTVFGTVSLNGPARNGGVAVTLISSNASAATVPSVVTVASGSSSASFPVTIKDVSQTCSVSISASYGGVSRRSTLVVADSTVGNEGQDTSLFIPIVLSSNGANNSFYTSILTLSNRGSQPAIMDLTYTASIGQGSGTASDFLLAGEQRVSTNAITYLKTLGIPIPDSGNRGGTLQVHFWGMQSAQDVAATVRTTTQVTNGRAGLSYQGVPPSQALTKPSYVFGLRQNSTDRSNLAIQNAGSDADGDVVLSITIYPGDPGQTQAITLPDEVIPPGGFKQFNSILSMDGVSLSNGFVRIERISGLAPYFAYGVINDQATSDGSFVPPIPEAELSGPLGLTLPAIVENATFNSELVLTNASGTTRKLRCTFIADSIPTANNSVSFIVQLRPGQQAIYPNLLQKLRDLGITAIPWGPSYVGALFVTDDLRDVSGIFVGARTSSPGGGGQYGLFYTGVPFGKSARTAAWIYGLQQNMENRSNLAIINTGELDSSTDVFKIDIYDGENGSLVRTVTGVSVAARHFLQISMLLDHYAPGVIQGYARVSKVSGNNPFITYGVINDGGEPGARTGDGTYVAMTPEQ